ncbi:diguanylate cyclase (GGDEF) domain-containing protein [Marinitoga hydrogenitolerans DSM 16785]|uniref:Diguanylate cyclase (GGDEF) domain-containing protein n=1 Tax=Marinitoga hydrogenitolerans (strain DSM 16785 / JCM 12826 / AT1271) TaxID=1122195 RepID=A0A1M5AYB9_MARH1|nr:GGDEF domain-containing protein [Marinitoga hydrogenitolerans]SHF35210.1 diguanylate cyclase (GGDEF) domain-containing protein [Marinitoga hydrogenitolerans DSM 16785]
MYIINYGIVSSIGGIILFLMIMIAFYIFYIEKKDKKMFFNFLFSLLFLFLATRDFYFIPLGNPRVFLIAKKIFFLSFILAFTFFLNTIKFKTNGTKFFSLFIKLSLLIPIAFYISATSFFQLMEYYNRFSWIPAFILIYTIFIYNKNSKYTMLFSFLIFTIIHDLILVSFPIKNSKFLLSYGIFSYTIFIGLTLVEELRKAHIKVKEISLKAFIDPLTNLHNRVYLENIPFSDNDTIIFFDMNDLKKINDKHGHDAGDKALIYLANTVKKTLRKNDYILRLGGDEFVAVMKNCSPSIAKQKFELIQNEIKNYKIPLSISYGITKYKNDIKKTLKSADRYMYRMKSEIKKSKKYKYKYK